MSLPSPPEVITTIAHKGGVGKSLTLRLLYQALARILAMNNENRKILVVDMDPQANTSSRWLTMEAENQGRLRGMLPPEHPDLEAGMRSDISDIWLKGEAPEPYATANPYIDVVPSREINLYALTGEQSHQFHIQGIKSWLSYPFISEDYCCVFIDTPPSKGVLNQAALAAATACYIPVEYEPYPIQGMDQMFHLVDSEVMSRNADSPLNFLGIIANKVPATRATIYQAYREAIREHPTYGKYMFDCELRDLAAFAETDAKTTLPGDIFDYEAKSHSHVLHETEAFCKSVFERLPAFADWHFDFRAGESFSEPVKATNKGA